MGEINKRHNRKITRPCPVCGGKVIVCHKNLWWVECKADHFHIPQRYFYHADEAVRAWDAQANMMTNYDKIREMPEWELAKFLCRFMDCDRCGRDICKREVWSFDDPDCHDLLYEWLKSPVEKGETV